MESIEVLQILIYTQVELHYKMDRVRPIHFSLGLKYKKGKLMNQIIENTKTKINRKIEKLKYNLLNTIQNEDPYYSEYTFFCQEHGTFKLFGWEIRIGKTCPD